MKDVKEKPSYQEEESFLAQLARDNLSLRRCNYCKYPTLRDYICMKCGRDDGK